jgi:hypothetical protein
MNILLATIALMVAVIFGATPGQAQSDEELARKLAHPIATLILVPFEFDYNDGYGSKDGEQVRLRIKPVVPIKLNEEWGVISRTILPVAWQDDIAGASGTQFGIGDTLQSLFFTRIQPRASGPLGNVVWGAGPVFSLATGTDELLGSEKWSAGPTGIVAVRNGPWQYGSLVNHLWSIAGTDGRADVNATFLEPYLRFVTKSAWTYGANLESIYDWESEEWSVPVNFIISKLTTIGKQKVSFLGGLRYWAESPSSGADGFGARFKISFVFPK